MSKKVTGPAIAIGIAAAGAGALIFGLTKDVEHEIEEISDVQIIREVDLVNRATRTPGGRLVRMVGVSKSPEAEITDDPGLGRLVEVDSPGIGLCHTVLEASSVQHPGEENNRMIPDIQAIIPLYGRTSWPVLLSGSCLSGKCMWAALFEGDSCLAVADASGYMGSTMSEFLIFPAEIQARFLRTRGTCTSDDGDHNCTVPMGDPRATPGAPVFVAHGWAGRTDANYVQAVDGVPDLRYDPESITPDGGVQPVDGGVQPFDGGH